MKRRIIPAVAFCAFLWAATPAWAQIAFDAAATPINFGAVTDPSLTFTVGSGNDRGLYAVFTYRHSSAGITFDDLTYSGVSMTKIAEAETTGGPGDTIIVSLWRLENPATGSNTLAGTLSAAPNDGGSLGCFSLTGVDQTDSEEANNTATGDSTTPSVAVTTITDNAWVVDGMMSFRDQTSIVSDQTERWEEIAAIPSAASSSFGPKTPAGSVTMSYVTGFSNSWGIVAAAIKPASAAADDLMLIQ